MATSYPVFAPLLPDPTASFGVAIDRLLAYGTELLGRITGALRTDCLDYLPAIARKNPHAAERRVSNAIAWLVALTRTLVGDRHYIAATRPSPAAENKPADTPVAEKKARAAPRHLTEDERDQNLYRAIRYAFAHDPIGLIARRICRRFGVTQDSDYWLNGLIPIAETPKAWNTRIRAEEAKIWLKHTARTASLVTKTRPTPTAPAPNAVLAPPYHPRE